MPIYEFRCQDCLQHFEVRISYQELKGSGQVCVHCGSEKTNRLLSRVNLGGGKGTSACSGCSPASPSSCSSCTSR